MHTWRFPRIPVSDWISIAAITTLALVVRLAGNQFGLPRHYHPDEDMLVRIASTMATGGDLNPHFFHWGGGHFYVSAIVLRAAGALGWLNSEADAYAVTRSLSAVMGAGTVLVTMLIARSIYRNTTITALTGLTFALTLLHVRASHYATVDVAATFWLTIAVWSFVLALKAGRGNLLLFFFTGICAGFATGTKYHIALVIPVLAAAAVMADRETKRRNSYGWWLILIGAALGFVAANPYAVLDYPSFSTGVRELLTHYDRPELHPRNHGDNNWLFFLDTLAGGESGVFFLLSAAAGAVFLVAEERRTAILLLASFPILSFLYLGSKNANFIRNLIPVIPFLAVAGALGMQRLVRAVSPWGRVQRGLAIVGVAVLMVMAFDRVVRFDRLLLAPDTRDAASEWLAGHLPPGSKVALERELWANPALPKDTIESHFVLPENPVSVYAEQGYGYLITNSVSYRAYFVYPDRVPGASAAYERLFADLAQHAELLATFTGEAAPLPVNDELPNPEIRIYRLKR